jgi:beta-glucosidase/6-phospho-beta-glucosidase/beta-galactosidase
MKVLGDKVRFWITLNEPEIYATQSYLTGIWRWRSCGAT